MHYKRKKPKGSSCCMCNPHKHNEFKKSFNYQTRQERKAIIGEKEQLDDRRLGEGSVSQPTEHNIELAQRAA